MPHSMPSELSQPGSSLTSVFRQFWTKHSRASTWSGVAVGLLLMLLAFGGYDADRSLDARGVETDAQVEKVIRGKDPQYRVRFTLPDGKTISTRTDYANGGARPGDSIRVEYDPEFPETVSEVGSRDGAWILYGTTGLTGVAALAHSIWRLWRPAARQG